MIANQISQVLYASIPLKKAGRLLGFLNDSMPLGRMKNSFIFCAALAQFSLLLPAGAQVTELNLARSKYTVAEPVGLVFETRLEQKNRQRFMTVICYTEGDFLVKQFNNPIVKISDVPYEKILEVRGTLREIMIVLDEYINNPGGKVEFSVGFNLYGGSIKLNQKGLIHPQYTNHRLQAAQRALINVDKAQKVLRSSVSGADQEKAQNSLRRAQRELEISQQALTAPIKDNEILYDHRESLQFFQWSINAIDIVPELVQLLDQSVINRFNRIPGAIVPATPKN